MAYSLSNICTKITGIRLLKFDDRVAYFFETLCICIAHISLDLLHHFCEFIMFLYDGFYKSLDFLLQAHYNIFLFLLAENKDKNKAEILLLSVAANIVSRHTSMVGVDKDRKEKVVGEMIQREVPLMTSHKYPMMVSVM